MQEDTTATLQGVVVEAPPYDIEVARAKITKVFRYLQELHRVRTPPNVDVKGYDWRVVLESMPHYPTVQRRHPTGTLGGLSQPHTSGGEAPVLRVGRPQETECPRPSVVIENWLKPGWELVGVDPIVCATRNLKTGSERKARERFEDSEERVEAYEEWLRLRRAWEPKERQAVEALETFSSLFDLWGRFQRESEKYQLYLADGVLVVDGPEGKVKHPLLLQKVQLEFDPLVPEFVIRETADNPEVYSPLLRYLGIEGKDLVQIQESVAEEHYHPLESESTNEFFKDLVQRFWPDGEFFENAETIESATGPYLYRQAQIFLGHRNQGFTDAIERYIEALPHFEELPESLLRIVGIDTGRGAEVADEDARRSDLLLTKATNPQQESVIHRLEETGAVLVQGPPGTGKSHTIANLIGHLLAQHKSILVTSHASKALRVVREHVVAPLQPLCVSLLDSDDESGKELEDSITGIVNYLASTSQRKLEKEIEKLAEMRRTIKDQHTALRRELLFAIEGEYQVIDVLDEAHSPAEVAKKLKEYEKTESWIPGPVVPKAPLPLEPNEVAELYSLGVKVTAEDERLLTAERPELDHLPTPKEFADLYDEIGELERENVKNAGQYWIHDDQTPEMLESLRATVRETARIFEEGSDWVLECMEAGRQQENKKKTWLNLARLIEKCSTEIPAKEELIIEHGPKIKSDRPAQELIQIGLEIIHHLNSGMELDPSSAAFDLRWQSLIEASEVDDARPKTAVQYQAIVNLLEVRALREELAKRWDRQMESLDAPTSSELGRKPERGVKPYTTKILLALNWYEEFWSKCEAAFEAAGFDWNLLLSNTPAKQCAYGETLAVKELLQERLAPMLEQREKYLRFIKLRKAPDEWLDYLRSFSKKEASYGVVKLLMQGLKKKNFDSYAQAWKKLEELESLSDSFDRRNDLLERLAPVAENWTRALRDRKAPHDTGKMPGDLEKAWRYRQWKQILADLHQVDLEAIQSKLNSTEEQLREVTALYVEKLAWTAEFERTGLKQQQALGGWLALQRKMGRGTGKHVARLKAEAKKTLVECRQSVPVWIMPLSKVVESFDLATTRFDVVILDEASQNDVMGLVAFAIGKEVLVVGDHEQVSPYAVGQEAEKVLALIDEFLDGIPNQQLYDGKTSVYDLARQSFGGTIRLVEHFRCVPDIIQFSNHLCYNGEILALREASASKVRPHLVAHRLKGGTAENKVNEREALEIASLICAMCRFEEYDQCTIGVISMVGTEQALRIDALLRRRLSVSEYKKRRLLCGNASQFQGDERDVILLSMVDSPRRNRLPIRQQEDARKVFNVAASRARDQLWVVHSLDTDRDLKSGDLRLKLISHAEDCAAKRKKSRGKKLEFASEFEERVFEELTAARFRPVLKYQLGELTIDMIVEGGGGERVAILCEGGGSQPLAEAVDIMERHLILERLGWKLIRLRASEFYQDPDKVMKRLAQRLKGYGIARFEDAASEQPTEDEMSKVAKELKKNLIRRAEMIRKRWK